jgi:hypothetical protein
VSQTATLELILTLKGDAEKQFANLEVDIKQVAKAAKTAETALQSAGGQGQKAGGLLQQAFAFATGGALLQGITGLAGALKGGLESVIGESSDAAEGQAALGAVLASTGGKAGVTAQAANDLASNLQLVTKFTDDQVLAGENMLLTFTNIGSTVFPRATEATLNMAQAFGGDTAQAAVQLGKALNDPITGISALQRVGVTFSQSQKDAIAAMMQTGDVAGAQTVILKELETEFGGAARAAGDTFPGQLAILSHRFDDMKQSLGDALMPSLRSLVDTLNSPQVQAGLSAAVQSLAAGLQAVLPVIGNVVGAALQLAGALGGPLQFALDNLVPVLATIALLTIPSLVTGLTNLIPVVLGAASAARDFAAALQLIAAGESAVTVIGALAAGAGVAGTAVAGFTTTLIGGGGLIEALAVLAGGGGLLATLAGGIAALVSPIGLVVVAVGALALAWNTDFLGMRTTFEPWVQSVADGVADVQAKLGHDLRAALGQSTADWDAAMAANARATAIAHADINTELEGMRDDWDQSGAMIAASTAQRGQENVAATQGIWHAIHQTTADTLQAIVTTAAQGGAAQAQGYLDNMVKQYGTGQPAIDAYLAFLIKRHDLGNALAIMGRNSAIKFLNALVLPVASGLEKMAASLASIQAFKGLDQQKGLDALTTGLRTAGSTLVGQWGAVTQQFTGFTSTFHAEVPRIVADIGKISGAGSGGGGGGSASGASAVAKAAAAQTKAAQDAATATAAATKAHEAALQAAADAVKKSYDEQGKAMSAGAVAALEAQQAQRDIQQGMVSDAEKNYAAYADAVKKGYADQGAAAAAAITQQLEDQQRLRDAAAAQAQAAQQLPAALEPALLALQQHTKSTLDVLSSLAPLATQAAAAGMPGLAAVVNQYMDQARQGVAVDGQAMYQSLVGYLQQMAQSGDSILSTFAQNAIQHLQLAAAIQQAQASLIPFQQAADAAAARLAAMNTEVQDAQKHYSDLQSQVSSARQAIQDFARAPLQGEGAFAQAMHANEQAVARVRLQMLDLQRGGVGTSDPRMTVLQRQLDRLQQQADRARLQNDLTIGDQRFNLEQAANTTPETSYNAAQQGIANAKDQVAALVPQAAAAQVQLAGLTREQAAAQEASQAAAQALQAQQAAVQALTAQLQAGQPVAAQYAAALGQTQQATGQFATQTVAALAPVGAGFDSLFGLPGDKAGPDNILNKLFSHDKGAFFKTLDDRTNEVMEGYAVTWSNKLTILDQRISDGLGTIQQTAVQAAVAIGQGIGNGMVDGIQSAAEAVAQAAVDIVNNAIAQAQQAAQIHSPSRRMAQEVGKPLAQGMALGMQQAAGSVAAAGAGLVSTAVNGAAVAGIPSAPVSPGGGGITINVNGPSLADLNFWRSVSRLMSIAINERPGNQLAQAKAAANA